MRSSAAGVIILSAMVLACNGLVSDSLNKDLKEGHQLQRVRRAPQNWWERWSGDGTSTDAAVTSTAPVNAEITSSTPPSSTTKRSKSKSRSKNSYTTKKPSSRAKPSAVEANELGTVSYSPEVSLDSKPTSPKPTASTPLPGTPGSVATIAPSPALLLSRPFIPVVKPKPLSAQYIEFQQTKIEVFKSIMDFNKFEVAYLSLQELQKIITPLLETLVILLGDACRSIWPHLSASSRESRGCSAMRDDASQELKAIEEWVLRNKNLRDSIETLSRDATSMHEIYGDALKKSLNGFVHPHTYTGESTYPESGYPNSAPASPSFPVWSGPVPIHSHFRDPRPATAPPTDDMAHPFVSVETTTGPAPMDFQTTEPPEVNSHTVNPVAFPSGTTTHHEFSNSAPSNDNFGTMEDSLRSFFGLPDESDGADDTADEVTSPKITKYINDMNSEDAVSIARSFLNKILEEGPSGNTEIFFFSTNLYAANPKFYDTLKSDLLPLVDTVVRKPKYRLQMNQDNNQTYALLVNSTTGMRSVETFGTDDQKVSGGYWKFLPRSHGELFLLFNVDTKTIIGAGSAWDADGLTFKNESDIIIKPFPDPDALNVADNFLWNLYLECDTEFQNNTIDSSEYEKCPPGHVYLEIRNEEFYNLKLTLDEDGNPALKSARTSWRLEAIE